MPTLMLTVICCCFSQVAKESVLQFHPQANIEAHHDSIMKYAHHFVTKLFAINF